MKTITMFSINFSNLTIDNACENIIKMAKDRATFNYVVTPNVDHIVRIQNNNKFKKVYEEASLVLPDGMPIILASKLLRKPLKEKVSGSDIFPKICEYAAKKNLNVFLLGGLEGVAEEAAKNLKRKIKNLNIVGTYSPPFGFQDKNEENIKIVNLINNVKPDILFVGLGSPKQEFWIFDHLENIKVPVSIGIGASFDFEAGTVKRAPIWMQKTSLEWFWRFIQEPRRLFKRYFIEDLKFLKILLNEIKMTKG